LTAHLILIVQNANVNKMTMRNVGIVFSPTLGIPAGVFSLMLAEFNRVFNVNDDANEAESAAVEKGSAIPRVSNPSGTDVNHRNSKHYLDATTDQLLGLSGRQLTGT
jgi:RalA-binding protein 1